MTLQELQSQALQLTTDERWKLVQALLESLQRETQLNSKRGNLSRLRGIAKSSTTQRQSDEEADYSTYLIAKYQSFE